MERTETFFKEIHRKPHFQFHTNHKGDTANVWRRVITSGLIIRIMKHGGCIIPQRRFSSADGKTNWAKIMAILDGRKNIGVKRFDTGAQFYFPTEQQPQRPIYTKQEQINSLFYLWWHLHKILLAATQDKGSAQNSSCKIFQNQGCKKRMLSLSCCCAVAKRHWSTSIFFKSKLFLSQSGPTA